MKDRKRILVGVGGGSGSGKTSVVQALVNLFDELEVTMVQQDTYYKDLRDLDLIERSKQNFDHPDAFDETLLAEHLEELLAGGTVQQPVYDFANHGRRDETRAVKGGELIILEGILALHSKKLRNMMALRIFVDAEADIRLVRRLRRDLKERGRSIESALDQYETTVRPMHMQFVEPTKALADLIISTGGENLAAIIDAKKKIESLLKAHS